ncbi:MAG: polysaccharide biosynthesis protein [Clostridia bacterium]|nr:polysaccharide biosynthesis protein [Clostridia bacterium]
MYRIIDKKREKSGIFEGIIGGALSLTVSAIVVKIIGLVYKIPISSILGDLGMGYFNSAYTVFGFFYLLCTAGVPKAIMILLSEAKARGRVDEERSIYSCAMRTFVFIGLGVTVFFLIMSAPIARLIGNSGSFYTMLAVAPSILFVSISGVLRGTLSADSHLGEIAISQIVEGVCKLALGLALAMVGKRIGLPLEIISALAILGVTTGSLLGAIYLFVSNKALKTNENTKQNVEIDYKGIRGRIFKISLPITVSAAIMSITSIVDLTLIMRSLMEIGYSEKAAGGLFGNYTTLAVPMLNLAISVVSPISVAFLPTLTRAITLGDVKGSVNTENSMIALTSLVCAPMMIGLAVYAREILDLLFKNSATDIGARLLLILTPAIILSSLLLVVNTSLEAAGRVRAPMVAMSFGGLAKIAVSYILITRTNLGILGAPIGTVVSYAVSLFTSVIMYTQCFCRRIPIFEKSLVPHLYAFISVILSRMLYERLVFSLSEGLSLLLSIALAALIYLGFSVIGGQLRPVKLREIAKYTKLS